MAQVLYWTVVPSSVAAYTNNATDAAKIKGGLDSASNAATATGTEATSGSTQTVTEATPATVTAGTSYRIAWTIYDDVATTYGGGTATYLVESSAFEVPFTATGALTSGSAVVAGTAVHYTLHASTGALTAQSAVVAGTTARFHVFTSTGALTAQSATVAGTAVHLTLHTSSGALTAQSATVAGTAALTSTGNFSATGALTAQSATVAGTAAHLTLHASTGALSAQSATVAGTAAHYTLHTSTGALEAQSATVSGTAVDESTYTPPAATPPGGGKSRKPRKRRYQVEVDGEVFDVDSLQQAEEVLANVAKKAEDAAALAVERAAKAKRRPIRKIMHDAEKALQVPQIAVPPDFRDLANQIIGRIQSQYKSALSSIEIAAQIAKREREIEEDDEEVMMLI